jgi:RND family efflux transporter MFP subunit
MKTALKIVLPVLLVVVAGAGALAMYYARPQAETRTAREVIPLVRVAVVEFSDLDMTVSSQGTVEPRTETGLVPEVAGRIIEVAPSFISGGFFESGQVLLRIDAHDYRQAVVRAQARVAQEELRLAREQAEAQVAADEWRGLSSEGDVAADLTLRVPQMAEAEAALAAAGADLLQAERNLERTAIKAPYAGRVRSKSVDVGQYVVPGTPMGVIYSVDVAEIRLPLPDRDLEFLDLPLVYRGEAAGGPRPQVTLEADFAGSTFRWQGLIVRTEGEIDRRSRMVTAVAQVKDPYGRGDDPDRPPLAVGMFVRASIQGRLVQEVTILPRSAVREPSQVLIVDEEGRLRFRDISILRRTENDVIVDGGLQEGDRICLSPLVAVVDGMQVRVEDPS